MRRFVSRPRGHCGHKWVLAEELYKTPRDIVGTIKASQCSECKKDSHVDSKFYRKEPEDHAIDSIFGLELALKETTRHGTVWVYGKPHLNELKQYIEAKLREGVTEEWSYFSRLPTWLKSAKNREIVLKAILKLEKRLVNK